MNTIVRGRAARLAVLALAAAAGNAEAQQPMTLVSVDSSGGQADVNCNEDAAVSADGRYVAFSSAATNLVPGDTNGDDDVFVHDRVSGATVRVSVDSSGGEADSGSIQPMLSADGRFVAFWSFATNLVPNDTNRFPDAFVHDRDPDGNGVFDEGNGVTIRVSVDSNGAQANGMSQFARISGDGSRVAFMSIADDLVAGDTNGRIDVFVRDLALGTTVLASVDSSGKQATLNCNSPSISADGRIVAFTSSASNLVANDTNGRDDVFLHDLSTGTTIRASVDSSGAEADAESRNAATSLSSDGTRVAFWSAADNLVANDTNGFGDVFVRDVVAGTTVLASLGEGGGAVDAEVAGGSISGDGHLVAFQTYADDVVVRDANHNLDVFLRDLALGTTELVSRDFTVSTANGGSIGAALSGDGTVVVFESTATNLVLGDDNGFTDVFAWDRSIPPLQGSWANYGTGLAGTLGVPALTLTADPEFGASFSLQIDNSSGAWTVAFLAIGTARASLPVHGGTLLVALQSLLPCGLPPSGFPIAYTVPYDDALYGFVLDLQAIEIDPGAAQGLSFTPGLELVFGQ